MWLLDALERHAYTVQDTPVAFVAYTILAPQTLRHCQAFLKALHPLSLADAEGVKLNVAIA